jgi:hypothetical protein
MENKLTTLVVFPIQIFAKLKYSDQLFKLSKLHNLIITLLNHMISYQLLYETENLISKCKVFS